LYYRGFAYSRIDLNGALNVQIGINLHWAVVLEKRAFPESIYLNDSINLELE
jgi:hypothetical protein